jgi:hypothetical protein
MSWKKHFRKVPSYTTTSDGQLLPTSRDDSGVSSGTATKYSSYLPEVYAGHPNRLQRYTQYDDMSRDSDISIALDIISEFSTQSEEHNKQPFEIEYHSEGTDSEVKILKTLLTKWIKLNDFKSRLFYMFRDTTKYGDTFFLRDPETNEWLWLDAFSVQGVKVDEENGREPTEYIVRGLDYNKQAKYAARTFDPGQYGGVATAQGYTNRGGGASSAAGNFSLVGSHLDNRQSRHGQQASHDLHVIDADHIVHLSLSAAMDVNWPFGTSILDPIYKVFKQKELLEDAIIIYRVQRAPERRVFYIDTGNMNPPKAAAHLQAIKNEIHQRRIPTRSGGGSNSLDAAYNPLSMMEDFFFAQGMEGRGSKVDVLPGGDNLGEIGDLNWFNTKLARGLHIPPSYIAIGEEGNVPYNDGKMGQAMVQEFRFTKYCMRIQNLLGKTFDREFKRFVEQNGAQIDNSIFELQFNPPQSFAKYRQMEIDMQQLSVYAQIADNKKISDRTKFTRYLGWSEDEVLDNERNWKEENPAKLKKATGTTAAEDNSDIGLSSVGLRGGGMDMGMPPEMGEEGDDMAGDAAGGPGAAVGGDAGMGGAPGGAPAGGAAGAAPAPGF